LSYWRLLELHLSLEQEFGSLIQTGYLIFNEAVMSKDLICIPAIKKDVKYVELSIKKLLSYFKAEDICIITPHVESFSHLEMMSIVVRNDCEYLNLTKDEIGNLLNEDKKNMTSWFYQQFLKYSIVSKSSNYDNVLILDSDTIILSDCITDTETININNIEYNLPYFNCIEQLLPDYKLIGKSAILNFMWFKPSLLNQLIEDIEKKYSETWIIALINLINKGKADQISFSEYETYATYKYNHNYKRTKLLKVFRRADLFNEYYSEEQIMHIAEFFGFDLISFETQHNVSLLKRFFALSVYIMTQIIAIVRFKKW
jgi:hypothetical protein